MARMILAMLLAASTVFGGANVQLANQELRPGTVVDLKLTNGEKLKARLVSLSTDSVEVLVPAADGLAVRTIPVQELKSIKPQTRNAEHFFATIGGTAYVIYAIVLTLALLLQA